MTGTRSFIIAVILFLPIFSYCQTGPGGIGSNDGTSHLIYWIDANRERTGSAPVSAISDLSGYNVTNTINGNPTFAPGMLNTFGAIRFDGDGDEIVTNLTINAITYPDLTVFAVYVPRIALGGSVWGEDNGEWDRFLTDINLTPTLNASVGAGYDPINMTHPCVTIDNLFNPGVATLTNVVYRDDDFNGTIVRVNGQTAAEFTSNAADYDPNGYSDFYVGAIGSNEYRFDGDIAEVIVFNNALSNVEQFILENSLSAKYGIPIADVSYDLYQQDDLGFDFDVAGIGMTNGIAHDESRGTGTVRVWSPTDLDNNEFFMWGHDNGDVQATNTDVPLNVDARSNRIWAISELNLSGAVVDVGNVSVSFILAGLGNIAETDLRLLIDTDADGSFADETPIAGATSLGNDEYAFDNVSGFANGVRFTYATANSVQTPLPVDLSDFKAMVHEEGNKVILSWTTLSERNNDRFEVLRSGNAKDWHLIGTVDGTDNSNVVLHYNFTDINPINENSYYRIRQVDFDGKTMLSEVVMVSFHKNQSLHFFPNPATDRVLLTGNKLASSVTIYSVSGKNFTSEVKIITRNDGAIELDVSALPEGSYIVVTSSGRGKLMKNRNKTMYLDR